MINANTLNNSFTAQIERARPISHLSAATLLVTSIYAVHEGAASILPGGLVVATTAAMVGMEWLQWTGLGRISKLDDAGEHGRSAVLKLQCAGIACLQVILYTLAVVNFARAAGADWSQGWPLVGSIVIAMLYAGLNFVAKWTSCDAIGEAAAQSGGPTGGTRVHEAIFSRAPQLAAPTANDDNVVAFDLERAIREKTARMEAEEAAALAKAPPVRSTAVRLRNAKKRIETRAWRQRKAA